MKEQVFIPAPIIESFLKRVFSKAGTRSDVANHVAQGLVQTSLRGVDSHGVRLFPHYLSALEGGRINPNPKYAFKKSSPSTGILDADHAFGHAAGMVAAEKAVKLAKNGGTGHVAVYNSTHFGAAAYYALKIASHDMIGMAFTNTDALVQTYGGKRPFLGNNPVAFAAPCKGEEPFCLDMATSVVTFNKIRQLREKGRMAPAGVGANIRGIETVNADEIVMLLPIGGYKGYGLSLMIEIMCSLLTGMPYGPHIPKMFEAPLHAKRFLGQFVIAIRIDCFQEVRVFKKRMSELIEELRNEPRLNNRIPIQVAGDPEKKMFEKRSRSGIPIDRELLKVLVAIGKRYNIELLRSRAS